MYKRRHFFPKPTVLPSPMYKPMTTRSVSGFSIARSAAYPPLRIAFSFRFFHLRFPLPCAALTLTRPQLLSHNFFLGKFISDQSTSHVHSLVNHAMEVVKAMHSNRLVRVTKRVELTTTAELLEIKQAKRSIRNGCLLEFRKDAKKLLLAVAQKPDGKKNWIVCDQNGVTSSIKPQQVTYIVAGIESLDHRDIPGFIQKAQSILDPDVLKFAWEDLLENKRSVTSEDLAEIIYGSNEPLESYCAHLLLTENGIYFNQVESKEYLPVYEPRPIIQVKELIGWQNRKEASIKEIAEFVKLLVSAKALPTCSKPSKCSWLKDEKFRQWITSLEAYAIDACQNDEQKKIAGNILKGMGLSKTSSTAMNLLIDIGYFPIHVNLDLLKFNISAEQSEEALLAAENLLTTAIDVDEDIRIDHSSLKVYAIDVDEADELDDALSAMKFPDGRIKVWIHVADPASLVEPKSIIDRKAMDRGTSIFLPTATFPMFPEKLAMEGMSLQQGKLCKAVSVSVTLCENGSIADYTIYNSIIKPTYMLTYENALELLYLGLEEESELQILSEASSLRYQWRRAQGAKEMTMIEPRLKVVNPDDPVPLINLYVEDQACPAMRIVSEMMILCGEVVAKFGSFHNIPLPYRGQPQPNISAFAFDHLPEGPVRSSAFARVMCAVEMDFKKPIHHGALGVPGYVQFTSPIRRYIDLVAHYQIKSFLRGERIPFTSGELEGMQSLVNLHVKSAKKLQNSSLRYWLLEYFRRQTKERKFSALILRFIKDRVASLLLVEVGIQVSAFVSEGKQIGDEIKVIVEEADPRDDILLVKAVSTSLSEENQINDEIEVVVDEAHPHGDAPSVKEVGEHPKLQGDHFCSY